MAVLNLFLTLLITCTFIIQSFAYNNTNCTYLQVELDSQKGNTYLLAYVPFVCMTYGKSSSGMFKCLDNKLLSYEEYDDANCANSISNTNNLDTGDSITIDSDSSTILDFDCRSTATNETCESLDIRVYTSCASFDSQFYDEVYIIDKCLPALDGKYQVITCTWFNATISTYSDDECTQGEAVSAYLYDDDINDCTDVCRDLSNCRRNFTLCSTHPWDEWHNRCEWKFDIGREFFCDDSAVSYCMIVSVLLCMFHALDVLR
eukprot:184928_1